MEADTTAEKIRRDMADFTHVLMDYHTGNLPCDLRVTTEEDSLLSSFLDISIDTTQNRYSPASALEDDDVDDADLLDIGSSNFYNIFEMVSSPVTVQEYSEDQTSATTDSIHHYQDYISTEYTDNTQIVVASEMYVAHQDEHANNNININNNTNNNSSMHLTTSLSAAHHPHELYDGSLIGSNLDAFLPMAALELKICHDNLLAFIPQLSNSVSMIFSSEWFAEEHMFLHMYTAMRKVYNTKELKVCEKSSVCLYRSRCAFLDRVVESFFGFHIRYMSNSPQIESAKLLQIGAVIVTFESPLNDCDIEALLQYGFLYECSSSADNEEQSVTTALVIDVTTAPNDSLLAIGGNKMTGAFAMWHNNSAALTFDLIFTSTLNSEHGANNYIINCTLTSNECFLFDSIVTPIGYSHSQMSVHLHKSDAVVDPQCQLFVRHNKHAFTHIRRNSNLFLSNKKAYMTIPYNPGTTALHNILSNAVVRIPTFDYTNAITLLTKMYFHVFLIHLCVHFHSNLSFVMCSNQSMCNETALSMFQSAFSCAFQGRPKSYRFHLEFNPQKIYRL